MEAEKGRIGGAHSSGAHEAGLPREEVQLGHRGVVRVPNDSVQLARLEVPDRDDACATARCHERDARACMRREVSGNQTCRLLSDHSQMC